MAKNLYTLSYGMPQIDELRRKRIDALAPYVSVLPWFSVDLLQKIYLNVFEAKHPDLLHAKNLQERFEIRASTCADFLQSPYVSRIAYNVFKLEEANREALRSWFHKEREETFLEMGEFMLAYVEACRPHFLSSKYQEVLKVEGTLIVNPQSAAELISGHVIDQLNKSVYTGNSQEKIAYFLNILGKEAHREQFGGLISLLEAQNELTKEDGDEEAAIQKLKDISSIQGEGSGSFTIKLPRKVQNEVKKRLEAEQMGRLLLQAKNYICWVDVPKGSSGNGILLAGGFLLTMGHILKSAEEAARAKLIFHIEQENASRELVYSLDPDSLFHRNSDETLDYVLVKVVEEEQSLALHSPANLAASKGDLGDAIANFFYRGDIGEEHKGVTRIESVTEDYLWLNFGGLGSSGSPVINHKGEVLALQQAGMAESSDPSASVSRMRAVWIENIREDLKEQGMDLGNLTVQKNPPKSSTFYNQAEILEALNRFPGLAENEFAQEALLIFSTEEQQTWLVTTLSNLYFLLDDQNTRELDSVVQRKVSLDEAQAYIKASHLNDQDKVIAIGARDNRWYYSNSIFSETNRIEQAVKELIGQPKSEIDFYEKDYIIRILNRFPGLEEGEFAQETLLIFSSKEEQLWLVSTSSNLYFLLDDGKTLFLDSIVKGRTPLEEAQSYIKASQIDDQDKLIAIGASDNRWYYSKAIFPNPIQIETAVEALIGRALGEQFLSLSFDSQVDKWVVNKGSTDGVKVGMHVYLERDTEVYHLKIEEIEENRSWIIDPEREGINLDLIEKYSVQFLTYSKPLCIYLNDIDHEPEIQASAEEALGEMLRLGYQVETPETANLFLNIFNELVYFSLPDQPFQPLGKQLNTLEENSNWEAELRQHIVCLENFSYLRYLENVASRGASQELLIEIQLEGEENWQEVRQEAISIETTETSRYGPREVWRQRFQLRITNKGPKTQYVQGFSLTTEGEILSSPFDGGAIELPAGETQLIYSHTKSQMAIITFEPYKEVYNWAYEERYFVFLTSSDVAFMETVTGVALDQEGLGQALILESEKEEVPFYTSKREIIETLGVYSATVRLQNPEYNRVSGELLEKEEAYFRNEHIAPFLNQLYPPEVLEKYARTPKREISTPTQKDTGRQGLRGVTRLAVTSGNYLDDLRRARKFRQNRRRMPDKPIILAEGDSWFLYPFVVKDIVDYLINDYPLRSIAAAGDYIEEWYEAGQLFREAKEIQPKYVLLSGGGIDFFGPALERLVQEGIQPGSNAEAYLNEGFYAELDRVMRIFEEILNEMRDYPSVKRVLVHGYDYIRADLPEDMIQSGNINRTLIAKGLTQASDRRRLFRFMIDSFNQRLQELEGRHSLLAYIDIRGMLDDKQWYDEMHPNNEGARVIADLYTEAIEREEQGESTAY